MKPDDQTAAATARATMPGAVLRDIERGLEHDEARRAAERARSLPPMGSPGCLCEQKGISGERPCGPWEVVPDCPHHGELWRDPETGRTRSEAGVAAPAKVAVIEENAACLDATIAGTAKSLAIELLQFARRALMDAAAIGSVPDEAAALSARHGRHANEAIATAAMMDVVAHAIKMAGDADLIVDKALAREPAPSPARAPVIR
jgi:hypothetical protein